MQKIDHEPHDIIASQVMHRLYNTQDIAKSRQAAGKASNTNPDWVGDFSRVLSGINLATLRVVVRTPMAHTLVQQRGERLKFSHKFVNLLAVQM